ncbi:MAG TPA: ABC transporter ATP-binding protein [Candidatus Nanopelagicales bacterium]
MTGPSTGLLVGERPDDVGAHRALAVRGVDKSFTTAQGVVHALHGVDLDVDLGEFVAVVGASGCGKSTLLSLVADLDQPTAGSVRRADRVALMFQDATLLPWLTARANVELALRLRGVPRTERAAEVDRLLAVVRLTGTGDRRPDELSGGMRQRVALARCLAQGTRIIAMDEPLGALDAMTRDHLHDEIERVAAEQRLTVLFVTHNMREAVRLADRVVLMAGGRVVHEQVVGLPRPRVMDSAEVATRAADLTARLRAAGREGAA